MIIVLVLLVVSTMAAGALMFALFAQSAAAKAGQAQAEMARACEAIGDSYKFFAWGRSPSSGDPARDQSLKSFLTAAVEAALRNKAGVEGGIRLNGATSLAYAYPTYQGSAPKTDEPAAESARIGAINATALSEQRVALSRFDAASQILLIVSCPLPGPIAGVTAWTMTRVNSFAGPGYDLLMAGIGVLLITLIATAVLLGHLTRLWSRHIAGIENTLQAHDIAKLPHLALTGERELDRIVSALNDLGERLEMSRREADDLTRQLAARERLAGLGRVAAGVAHEIRNPIAAMRLRAETGLEGAPPRQGRALTAIIAQVDRLETFVAKIVSGAKGGALNPSSINVADFLRASAESVREHAEAGAVVIDVKAEPIQATFDPEQMRTAITNLLANAIDASSPGSRIDVLAEPQGDVIVFRVRDHGHGVSPEMRDRLFEPFATDRAEGAGLGLATVREIAKAHRGVVRLVDAEEGATFEMILPCRPF
jgi:signal transduction histidine kinase